MLANMNRSTKLMLVGAVALFLFLLVTQGPRSGGSGSTSISDSGDALGRKFTEAGKSARVAFGKDELTFPIEVRNLAQLFPRLDRIET